MFFHFFTFHWSKIHCLGYWLTCDYVCYVGKFGLNIHFGNLVIIPTATANEMKRRSSFSIIPHDKQHIMVIDHRRLICLEVNEKDDLLAEIIT